MFRICNEMFNVGVVCSSSQFIEACVQKCPHVHKKKPEQLPSRRPLVVDGSLVHCLLPTGLQNVVVTHEKKTLIFQESSYSFNFQFLLVISKLANSERLLIAIVLINSFGFKLDKKLFMSSIESTRRSLILLPSWMIILNHTFE